jgi:AcrR family transcriptional regulator
MATPISSTAPRRAARRQASVDEALDHAEDIVREQGAGALTVSEIARRMGMRPPSLYKYFPSLHAIYDALFARGHRELAAYLDDSVRDLDSGLARLLAASRAIARWGTERAGLAPLLFWRPVPGFAPSPESYAPSEAVWERFRQDLRTAVRKGQLRRSADSDAALRMLTIVISGISSQQLANEPDKSFEDGAFTSLIDEALQMFANHYAPPPRKGSS